MNTGTDLFAQFKFWAWNEDFVGGWTSKLQEKNFKKPNKTTNISVWFPCLFSPWLSSYADDALLSSWIWLMVIKDSYECYFLFLRSRCDLFSIFRFKLKSKEKKQVAIVWKSPQKRWKLSRIYFVFINFVKLLDFCWHDLVEIWQKKLNLNLKRVKE